MFVSISENNGDKIFQ